MNVLVPWRPSPDRQRAWDWVRNRYEQNGFMVIEGHAPEGEWCKALAVADAASRASGGVVVVADADVWCDGLPEAIAAVEAGAPWAIPHHMVRRLTKDATDAVLDGGPLDGELEEEHRGTEGGGIVVLPLDTLNDVPLDPRFRGWGQEDFSWSCALNTLAGARWRGTAPLWHLWHQPQERMDRKNGNPAGRRLQHRYGGGNNDPGRIMRLIEEAKEEMWLSRSS